MQRPSTAIPDTFDEACDLLDKIATYSIKGQQQHLNDFMPTEFYGDTNLFILRLKNKVYPAYIVATRQSCCTFGFYGYDIYFIEGDENHDRWQSLFKALYPALCLSSSNEHYTKELVDYLDPLCSPSKGKVSISCLELQEQIEILSGRYFHQRLILPRIIMLATFRYFVNSLADKTTPDAKAMTAQLKILQSIYFPELRIKVRKKMLRDAGLEDSELLRTKETTVHALKLNNSDLSDCYRKIYECFSDSDWCLTFLKDLEAELVGTMSPEDKKRFTEVHRHRLMYLYNNHAYVPVIDDAFALPKTFGHLRCYFERFFADCGFLINGQLLRTAGFIDSYLFDSLNELHALLLENFKWMGVVMVHGKFPHLIQLWILYKAYKAGEIKLPEGMTFLAFVARLHKDKTSDGRSLFSALFDSYGQSNCTTPGFLSGFIMRLNAEDQLPVLAAFLTISVANGVRQNELIHKLSARQVMALQLLARNKFMNIVDDGLLRIRQYLFNTGSDIRIVTVSQGRMVIGPDNCSKVLPEKSAYLKNPAEPRLTEERIQQVGVTTTINEASVSSLSLFAPAQTAKKQDALGEVTSLLQSIITSVEIEVSFSDYFGLRIAFNESCEKDTVAKYVEEFTELGLNVDLEEPVLLLGGLWSPRRIRFEDSPDKIISTLKLYNDSLHTSRFLELD